MAVPIGSVLPTGWRGFSYVGAKGNAELYKCEKCRAEISVTTDHPPILTHPGCQITTPSVPFRDRGDVQEGGVF